MENKKRTRYFYDDEKYKIKNKSRYKNGLKKIITTFSTWATFLNDSFFEKKSNRTYNSVMVF